MTTHEYIMSKLRKEHEAYVAENIEGEAAEGLPGNQETEETSGVRPAQLHGEETHEALQHEHMDGEE